MKNCKKEVCRTILLRMLGEEQTWTPLNCISRYVMPHFASFCEVKHTCEKHKCYYICNYTVTQMLYVECLNTV